MRRFLFVLLLFVCGLSSQAQDLQESENLYDYYCSITMSGGHGCIRFPNMQLEEIPELTIVDNEGVAIEFQDIHDVLYYMAKNGWEYIDHYSWGSYHKTWFLLKKKVFKDEDALMGIKLAEKPNKKKKG